MSKTLYYLFDPLCGWCYGATSTIAAIVEATDIKIQLLPTGLFCAGGARPMDDAFAAYAWGNDQRIERLTGQPFSERYRNQVLLDRTQMLDSGPATIALSAVALTVPMRELSALKAIQHARYVDGKDVTRIETLREVLEQSGLTDAARQISDPPHELLGANQARIKRASELMQRVGAQGVPTFIVEEDELRLLPTSVLFSNPGAFLEQLTTNGITP